jgi:glutaminyl-peptide cyclotransferase
VSTPANAPLARRRPAARAGLAAMLSAGALVAAGCGDAPEASEADASRTTVPTPRTDNFDVVRAYGHLRSQVRMGPRPAGSPTSRRLAVRLRRELPRGRFEAVPGDPPGMRNVVGHLPGRRPAILVGAHYDTFDIPRFVGANDGAAGTAAVVELSRALARGRRACAREIRFVLFDGEEAPPGSPNFIRDGLRGSKAYAARHQRAVGSVVVLDFIANHDVRLPREAGSDPVMWARLRQSARSVGVDAIFPDRVVPEILDDHTPFARRGIPAIDLIDFSYPQWHRPGDNMSAVSARSLDAVGEAVYDFVRRESERTCR